ncbi:MAG: hypothetical protein JGK21_32070, partial [Microcoleus sp. PH2017_22_RUC_O_B]|nr:hypothetical protein [Microcoleus sp. PH2017_22_RUC_O_B]
TVLDGLPPESITAAKIAETLDENPEDRAKQVRIGGKAYKLLQKKAIEAGLTVSQYLEKLIGGDELPDEGTEPTDEEDGCSGRSDELAAGEEYAAEQLGVLDECDRFFAARGDRDAGALGSRPEPNSS